MKISKLLRLGASLAGMRGMRSTYRPKVGPFTLNTSTRSGLSSASVGTGPLRFKVWDRRGNTGLSSVDLPGPISYRPPTRTAEPTKAQSAADASAPLTMNPDGMACG